MAKGARMTLRPPQFQLVHMKQVVEQLVVLLSTLKLTVPCAFAE